MFIHGGGATPLTLVEAMVKHGRKASLKNVEVVHIHTEGKGEYMQPEFEGKKQIYSTFILLQTFTNMYKLFETNSWI